MQASAPANLPLTPRQEQEVRALAAALQVWRDLRSAGDVPARQASALGQERRLVLTDASDAQTLAIVRPASAMMVTRLEIFTKSKPFANDLQSLATIVLGGTLL